MRLFILILCTLLIAHPVKAEKSLDLTHFKTLPIMDEGRLKPLQSFAIIKLKTISGQDHLDNMSADEWLTLVLFTPDQAAQTQMFDLQNRTLKNQLELPKKQTLFSLQELQPGMLKLEDKARKTAEKEEQTLSADERALLDLYERVTLYMLFSQSLPILTSAKDLPDLPEAAKGWANLAKAWKNNDTELWDSTLKSMNASAKSDRMRFKAENLYRTIKPYSWILGLYALGILLISIKKAGPAILVTTIGAALHIAAIGTRIYILDRPPVGTLYESVLFVSLICVIAGLLMNVRKAQAPALITGAASAIILLALAPTIAPQGDSLEVLVAVLNTNFWLATHVLCITIGYGICILAAGLAHIALALKAFKPDSPLPWLTLQRTIHHTSLAALLFTCIGTILGGIWADQSWGRFWGWDPKENGALLIVLWLIWIQHGRLSNHLKPLGFVTLSAYLGIIVSLAWFGVNLLSTGLHSYGFTSGLAGGLFAFCALETAFITALVIRIKTLDKGVSACA